MFSELFESLSLVRPHLSSKRIILSSITKLVSVALNIAAPFVLTQLLDKFIRNSTDDSKEHMLSASNTIIIYGGLWTAGQIFSHLSSIVSYPALNQAGAYVTLDAIKHLNNLSKPERDRENNKVYSTIQDAHQGATNLVMHAHLKIWPATLQLTGIILIVYYGNIENSVSASGILVGLLGSYIVITPLMLNWVGRAHDESIRQSESTFSRLFEIVGNYDTIQYFQSNHYELDRAKEAQGKLTTALASKKIRQQTVSLVQSVLSGIGLTLLTLQTGGAVLDKNSAFSVADFVLINIYILSFLFPLSEFGDSMTQIKYAMTDLRSARRLLKLKPSITDAPEAQMMPVQFDEIKFNNVKFKYTSEDQNVLDGISFIAEKGKITAIVGTNGSGKSTLLKLLFRMYDTNDGEISINDINIKNIKIASLRAQISVVPQRKQMTFFQDTVRKNIQYGNRKVEEQVYQDAVNSAQLRTTIDNLPSGDETVLNSDDGLELSGGTEQRLGIARALVKQSRIYIYDEPTSELDANAEGAVMQHIRSTSQNSATIVVAQRLSTIRDADKIIVIDKGKVVDEGTHENLMQKGTGFYFNAWQELLGHNAATLTDSPAPSLRVQVKKRKTGDLDIEMDNMASSSRSKKEEKAPQRSSRGERGRGHLAADSPLSTRPKRRKAHREKEPSSPPRRSAPRG